jgi:hypothetical protein
MRSVAPAVRYIDSDLGEEAFCVRKDELITLWGCELMPLQSDCVKISYKSSPSASWQVLKNYLVQTSIAISGGHNPTDASYTFSGFPSLADNYELNDPLYANGFQISGITYCREHDSPFKTVGYSLSWIYRVQDDTHAKVSYTNFGRGFRFYVEGYYKFEYDESRSALYRQTSSNFPIVNPDTQDYNTFKYNGSVPWTPSDSSLYEHGDSLVRSIIIKCKSNFDVVSNSTYVNNNVSISSSNIESFVALTADNICKKVGLNIKSKSYLLPSANGSVLARQYCASDNFLIDVSSTGVASSVINQFDKAMGVQSGEVVKNLRNRTFDTANFLGPGDFVQHIASTPGSLDCAQKIDMRNSRFYNCIFKNVIFGSPGNSQLILDGSLFFQCSFFNCKFYLNGQNIAIKNCNVNNSSVRDGFLIFNGSYGNMISDVIFKDTDKPFVFVNGVNANRNNFIMMNNCSQAGDVEIGSCPFVNVVGDSNNSGSFSGNIVMRNYIDDGSGDPIRIEKTSAHGNFFGGNYMISHGNVSLADDARQKQKNKDIIKYPSIKPYIP